MASHLRRAPRRPDARTNLTILTRVSLGAICVGAISCSDTTRPSATELRIEPADTTVVAGAKYQLRVVVRDNGAPVSLPMSDLSVESSDTAVATVTPQGVVTTNHFGEARIRAFLRTRDGMLEATAVVRSGAATF